MTPHADVGAYLLGALDDAEMSRFEEHLAGCEECGRELDDRDDTPAEYHQTPTNRSAHARRDRT